MTTKLEKYLHDRTQLTPGCWIWKGSYNNYGYGRTKINQQWGLAHRLMYELYNGPIEKGNVIRHRCDNHFCVNPDHLLQGTYQDNMDDCVSRNRQAKGESVNTNKLTEAEALQIIDLLKSGVFTHKKIASLYGVHRSAIHHISCGNSWKHLKRD